MIHSEHLNELAKALSGFQSEIMDAEKDTDGYGYKYAELSQVLSLIRPLLGKYGLSFTQPASCDLDKVTVVTLVMHESGQWMRSELTLPAVPSKSMNAAQAVGSIITYARRYSLTSIFGITQSDQDGALDKPEVVKPRKFERKYAPAATSRQTVLTPAPQPAEEMPLMITPTQVIELSSMIFNAQVDQKAFLDQYGITNLQSMPLHRYSNAINRLQATIDAKKPLPEDYLRV